MTPNESLHGTCLKLEPGTTIEFEYKGKTYRICIRRPFVNSQKEDNPVRLEPYVRNPDKDGVTITSLEVQFVGTNGDQKLSHISFKIRGQNERIRLDLAKVGVIPRNGGQKADILSYLTMQLGEGPSKN